MLWVEVDLWMLGTGPVAHPDRTAEELLERHHERVGRHQRLQSVVGLVLLAPEDSAGQIWDLLPPDPNGRNVLYIGEMVEGAAVQAT